MGKEKILVISGDKTCYGALNEFARSFTSGLRSLGYEAVNLCIDMLDEENLDIITSKDYKAVIGFQTNLFVIELNNRVNVGDLIPCHKFNFVFDPPATKRQYFEKNIRNLTLLYHDSGYIDYLNRHFPYLDVVFQAPGGGIDEFELDENVLFSKPRKFDMSFIGSYADYRSILETAIRNNPDWASRIIEFFEYMLARPFISTEKAIEGFSKDCDLDVCHDDIPGLLEIFYPSENAVKSYYREKVIKSLLDEDIAVDVFSETWNRSPFANHKNLNIHKDISYRDSMAVISDSKLSMNVFSWHKQSLTERVPNIMLQGAVCVSDYSDRLPLYFENNSDIIIYSLKDLNKLCERVWILLEDTNKRIEVARAGYINAYSNHRWINRVNEIMRFI